MYESPIEVIQKNIEMQMENGIYKAVTKVGINVDKEELLKALNYDRRQYDKGYTDGWDAHTKSVIRCKDCKYHYVDGDNVKYNLCLLNHNKVQSDEWFCADGEKVDEVEE